MYMYIIAIAWTYMDFYMQGYFPQTGNTKLKKLSAFVALKTIIITKLSIETLILWKKPH